MPNLGWMSPEERLKYTGSLPENIILEIVEVNGELEEKVSSLEDEIHHLNEQIDDLEEKIKSYEKTKNKRSIST